jgi:hypothetical protein
MMMTMMTMMTMMMMTMMMMHMMMPVDDTNVERREIYCLLTNKTKQNKTKQNKTKQNKTKQNKTKQNKTKPTNQKNIFFMKGKEHKRLLFNKNISQIQCLDLQKTMEGLPTARIGRR